MMTDLTAAIANYTGRGWRLILLRPGGNEPVDPNRQIAPPPTDEVLARADGHPYNLGVLLGAPSGGLVEIDLDAKEAARLADTFLPPTGAIFGRPSRPRSHRFYYTDPPVASVVYRDQDDTVLVEIRSDRHQTMIPPSRHPTGDLVHW